MRRSSIFLLSAFLIFSGAQTVSAEAPKAGASCKKLGATAIAKGKEYKCIKKGSKRVWSKGVSIKVAPTPISSPLPSAVVTPTPSPTPSLTTTPTPTPTLSPAPTPTVKEFTRAEVAQRNTVSSCWVIINGNVYDLTQWINAHPGGPGVIRSMCGVDGSSSFRAQHENQSSPMRELNRYYLGPLKP